ncbi:MAG: calcineurin-like phosphoesterase C-terminal domain-containing protein [Alistipes sp.]|nr:calcineurin-like phosphoesterase C-terminal domain-containing protein [Alistipes sp.]
MNTLKNYHFILLAIFLLSTACVKDSNSIQDESGLTPEELSNSIELSLPHTTRISLGAKQGNEYPVYWSASDRIAVNGVASQSIEIDEDDARRAIFHFGDNYLTYPYSIIYPHSEVNSVETPKIIIPAEQSYVEGSFATESVPMCSYVSGKGEKITMRYLAGVLRFEMKAEMEGIELTSITITSESGRKLAGEFTVDVTTGEVKPTPNTSTSITYTLPKGYTLSTEKNNVFHIAVSARSLGSCNIVFKTANNNTMQMRWSASGAVKPGVIREFQPITFSQEASGELQPLESEEDSFIHRYSTIFGQVRDTDNNPIAGVAVSDGFSVVTTNEYGYYSLDVHQDAWYIFISVPAEYKIPVNKYGLPCFFKKYPGYSEWFNFTLEKLPGGKESEFMLFGLADPQVSRLTHIERFSTQVAPEIKSHSASLGKPCYGITLGDVISMGSTDLSKDILPAMRDAMHADKVGMPVFQVMGNHDNCYMTASHPVAGDNLRDINLNIQRMFEDTFGPINYSFNRGDAHIIGMKDVQWQSGDDCSTDNTKTAFTEEQYNWLKADLALVPKDKIVVLCVHIPIFNGGAVGDGTYRQEALNLLDEFAEAHVISGHTHYQHNYDHTKVSSSPHKIYEHAQAAVNGASWTSNINGDGVPNGYEVYHFSGNTIKDWYYKGYAEGMNKRDYQIRLYRGDAITGAAIPENDANKNGTKGYYQFGYDSGTLLANVFNSDPYWTVEVYENGKFSGNMASLSSYHGKVTYEELIGSYVYDDPKRVPAGSECGRDFWAIGVLCGHLGMNNGGLYYKHCYQLWKYTLKNPNATIEVRATDRKGNVYKCSKITEGTDMTYALYNN